MVDSGLVSTLLASCFRLRFVYISIWTRIDGWIIIRQYQQRNRRWNRVVLHQFYYLFAFWLFGFVFRCSRRRWSKVSATEKNIQTRNGNADELSPQIKQKKWQDMCFATSCARKPFISDGKNVRSRNFPPRATCVVTSGGDKGNLN